MLRRLFHPGAGALFVALGLAACAHQVAVAPPPPAPVRHPPTVQLTPPGLVCLEKLGQRGIVFDIVADRVAANGCNLTNGVQIKQSLIALDKPATLTCPMAVAFQDFEEQVIQPAAQRIFKRRVILVRQLGSYSCRDIRGTRRLSEHARGQAIDVAGFDLDNGMKITIKDNWKGNDDRAHFLQEVAKGACKLFNVVLTPKSGADHHDHIHVDIGPYPLCDA
jgi:hypothetical protein